MFNWDSMWQWLLDSFSWGIIVATPLVVAAMALFLASKKSEKVD